MKNPKPNSYTLRQKVGILLFIISTITYTIVIFIPFFTLKAETKILLSTVLILIGEGGFWIGAILAGNIIVKKLKNIFFFWRKKDYKTTDTRKETC